MARSRAQGEGGAVESDQPPLFGKADSSVACRGARPVTIAPRGMRRRREGFQQRACVACEKFVATALRHVPTKLTVCGLTL
jgi:hypothetical protein